MKGENGPRYFKIGVAFKFIAYFVLMISLFCKGWVYIDSPQGKKYFRSSTICTDFLQEKDEIPQSGNSTTEGPTVTTPCNLTLEEATRPGNDTEDQNCYHFALEGLFDAWPTMTIFFIFYMAWQVMWCAGIIGHPVTFSLTTELILFCFALSMMAYYHSVVEDFNKKYQQNLHYGWAAFIFWVFFPLALISVAYLSRSALEFKRSKRNREIYSHVASLGTSGRFRYIISLANMDVDRTMELQNAGEAEEAKDIPTLSSFEASAVLPPRYEDTIKDSTSQSSDLSQSPPSYSTATGLRWLNVANLTGSRPTLPRFKAPAVPRP